ncbi:COG4315 family predicted lipoprotein [Agrococcus sp. TSP3-2-1]|uniref:COG4315 family predicted lipoprotein n=1 Tax=Agrococcus sp. TSP3-2-1 TaxID=2804583 RepID=UPI003CFB60DB
MTTKTTAAALAAGLLVVALAGCTSAAPEPEAPTATTSQAPESSSEPDTSESAEPGASALELAVADSPLGEIVVDGEGMTVYMFDSDTQGAGVSTCEGQCATNWPAVTTDGDVPDAEGVMGELGTIVGVDGATQVTLNGWPLYYFAGDSAAGDVAGQGVNDVWWVLSPAGERMAE